ncbi:ACT domain-containing protein [Fusibacter sp. JL216-2]|uniref:ACT domain-containing protein n=1 Tax=Fusibacter sp. JL216-2 TaxID=3071453 RepID=UPI003D334AC6
MDKKKYLVVHADALPDVYKKVVDAKELIKNGEVTGVSEAVKAVGISRSTYYKYSDHVFSLAEGALGKKVTLTLLLHHESGILSTVLDRLAQAHCNILTISQDTPINGIANVSLTFDISELKMSFEALMDELKGMNGVKKLTLIAME